MIEPQLPDIFGTAHPELGFMMTYWGKAGSKASNCSQVHIFFFFV